MCSDSNLMLLVKEQSDEVFRKGIGTSFGRSADQGTANFCPKESSYLRQMGFWGSERDGQTVFTECKITLPHAEGNSKEKREEYRLNTHMCELTLSHLHTHLHTHTHTKKRGGGVAGYCSVVFFF